MKRLVGRQKLLETRGELFGEEDVRGLPGHLADGNPHDDESVRYFSIFITVLEYYACSYSLLLYAHMHYF